MGETWRLWLARPIYTPVTESMAQHQIRRQVPHGEPWRLQLAVIAHPAAAADLLDPRSRRLYALEVGILSFAGRLVKRNGELTAGRGQMSQQLGRVADEWGAVAALQRWRRCRRWPGP